MDEHDCFLTPLQQKLKQILSEYRQDPTVLQIQDESDEMDMITSYIKVLLREKERLQQYGHAGASVHLIDAEIRRLFMAPISMTNIEMLEDFGKEVLRQAKLSLAEPDESLNSVHSDDEEEITLAESILIPVDAYPTYNFIGRIIGPRGMTAKQLEKDTGCRIMIRGNYSNKTYGSSSQKSQDEDSIDSPLRVIIETSGRRDEATARLSEAYNVVSSLLVPPPDGRDELKRRQLVELAIMNGTYRPTSCSSKSDN